ncbi:MAG: serine--tRNA ligase [Candidatus Kerfeldbacteria bacterium]
MLDIKLIRENSDSLAKSLAKRGVKINFDNIIKLDNERKEIILKVEKFKEERNKYSKTKPDTEIINKMKSVGASIKELDLQLSKTKKLLKDEISSIPNIPADDVVAGGKENNKVLKTFGKAKDSVIAKDHVDIGVKLGIVDYKKSAQMSGNGFWTYVGDGALLEWALLNYFIDFHRSHSEYKFMIPPYMLNENSAFISGHLPKFKEDLFWVEKDKLCLNATSEMMLGNYHANEILNIKDLPLKYYAFSTCFRRESGAYRKEERGMIRGHQFNKIEMFHFIKPEDSWTGFDELLKYAEELVNGLDLAFQTVQLAAGDCSAAMAKTVDIEVWIPSMKTYKEVSSVSNALDYQARRGNIRYKDKEGKNQFIHTLNASGLATSRIFPAILEQNLQKDGSVKIPKVLQKYMGGVIEIKPKK